MPRTAPERHTCSKPGCRKKAVTGRKRCPEHRPGPRKPEFRPCRIEICQDPAIAYGYCDGHLRDRRPAEWARRHKILGKTEARLFTPPLRPLTRQTSHGFAVIDFAEMIGEPLLPWQQWAVIHALELNLDGTYRFRTVLILVARQNGKSQLKRIVSLWRMYVGGATRILGIAQDVALARDQWNMCQETIHNCPDLEEEWGKVRNVNGDEWFTASGCKYAIKAANRRAGRGGSNDEVNIDELREQQDWKAWAAVSKTTMARAYGQIWAMSNAGDDNSVVLNQLRGAALAGTDETICLLEWSGPDDCELDDVEAWAQANPGMGYIISEASIRSSMGTDPPAVFRTEVLCQQVDQLDGAIDLAGWKAGADPAGSMDKLRDRLSACFDIAPDETHCTLSVAGRMRDGKVRVEVVRAWKTTAEARAELPGWLEKNKEMPVGWFPVGPGAAFAPIFRKHPAAHELTGGKVTEACQGLADLVKGRQIVHANEVLLNAHISGARKLPSGDGWRFTRRGGVGHVDGAYSVAGAVYLLQTMPEPRRGSVRVMTY